MEKKTKVMLFNGFPLCDELRKYKVVEQTKILGLMFTENIERMYEANWPTIVNSIRGALASSFTRQLNVVQRF